MKLSICIPVEQGDEIPVALVQSLLADEAAPIEIIVALYEEDCDRAAALFDMANMQERLRILPPVPAGISVANLWIGTVAAMTGEWVTVLRSGDAVEPAIARFIAHAEDEFEGIDAFAWNLFQIDRKASPDISASVAIPIQHHVMEMDRDQMTAAFYAWKQSGNTPRMPFGIYHAAIRRSLLETVLMNSGEKSWRTSLPQYEWAARIILYAKRLAFSYRPLSAIDVQPLPAIKEEKALADFPFDPRAGVTAAIAEIQARVLSDLGRDWAGFGEDFVRACMIDCMLEHDEPAFERKGQSYYQAIAGMEQGRLVNSFRPPYLAAPEADTRRGLRDEKRLFVNRFIGGAVTAQEFFALVRHMLAPAAILEDNLGELLVSPPASRRAA